MRHLYFTLISIAIIPSIYSICNHYYQSSGPSSTKRPFDICYHSEIDGTLKPSSWRYYCIESTSSEYGNNSIDGFTAFREDFNSISCSGKPNQTRIVSKPYRILCESSDTAQCEIVRFRQYPVINISTCTYNESVYAEDIEVIAICDDNGDDSKAIFCNKKDGDQGSYFWTNTYYNGQCESSKLFEASYQFHGCQGYDEDDGSIYLQILQCDFNYDGITAEVKPFDDSLFVAGFVLLLIAILCIIFILIWYCCWFRKGFKGSLDKGVHVGARSTNFDEDDDEEQHHEEAIQMSQQTNTMR